MESRVRASSEQLLTLLEFMETHGDLARPPAGSQGRIRSYRLWSELTNILNAVGFGGSKTTDKWKKVWADWKTKTKKKSLTIRHRASGTGGGPANRQTLSASEDRVLAIMGASGVEGQVSVEELGLNGPQYSTQDDPVVQDDTVYLEIVDETPQLTSSPQPSTPQPSNNWLLPSSSQMQTPLPLPLPLTPPSAQGRQPAALSLPATPAPAAPSSPAPSPLAPSPPAPAAPTTPPRASATSPSARRRPRLRSQSAASPDRPRLRARRRQAPTPFERAANEFTAVELRRLELEELRIRLQHERDLRALEVEHERNQLFRSLADVAQAWLDNYRSRDNTKQRDDPMPAVDTREIKVFCPKCKTKVLHNMEGMQKDETSKIIIANVYHYFEQEYEKLTKTYEGVDLTPLSKFIERTALATGVSVSTVLEKLQERANADVPQNPARKRPRQPESSSEEDSSGGDEDDGEHSTAEHVDEPEVYVQLAGVKTEPDACGDDRELADPISVHVKIEPQNERDTTCSETVAALSAAKRHKGSIKQRHAEAPPASCAAPSGQLPLPPDQQLKADNPSTNEQGVGRTSAAAARRSPPSEEYTHA